MEELTRACEKFGLTVAEQVVIHDEEDDFGKSEPFYFFLLGTL